MRLLFAALACVLLSPLGAYGQTPSYRLDAQQRTVLEIWNLNPGSDCHVDRFSGRVATRQFDSIGTVLTGVTLQGRDGTREHINVDVKPGEWDRLTAGWVMQGLQQMTAPGNRVEVVAHRCGAAGRFLYLDAIRRSR